MIKQARKALELTGRTTNSYGAFCVRRFPAKSGNGDGWKLLEHDAGSVGMLLEEGGVNFSTAGEVTRPGGVNGVLTAVSGAWIGMAGYFTVLWVPLVRETKVTQ